jgi:hypothetical protein
MIFAKEISDGLTSLVKKVDEATQQHKDARLGGFAVVSGKKSALEPKLKEMVEKLDLKKVVLAIEPPEGPQGYTLPKDSDVTVVFYVKKTVKSAHSFRPGELKESDIDKLLGDLQMILPEKK